MISNRIFCWPSIVNRWNLQRVSKFNFKKSNSSTSRWITTPETTLQYHLPKWKEAPIIYPFPFGIHNSLYHPVADVLQLHSNDVTSTIQMSSLIFGVPIRKDILQRVVVWQLAKRRQGSASKLTRSEVSGSNKKPWKQKGTGLQLTTKILQILKIS
jgi:hypothetical protein